MSQLKNKCKCGASLFKITGGLYFSKLKKPRIVCVSKICRIVQRTLNINKRIPLARVSDGL